jgi:hypothetical protein
MQLAILSAPLMVMLPSSAGNVSCQQKIKPRVQLMRFITVTCENVKGTVQKNKV